MSATSPACTLSLPSPEWTEGRQDWCVIHRFRAYEKSERNIACVYLMAAIHQNGQRGVRTGALHRFRAYKKFKIR